MKNTLSDRLNYLTTIAEEQSITRAATRLFISQPALTAFLSRTEEELGTRLFDRTSTPIRITEAGAYYLSELEKICVMQDRLHQELADFSADDQELRLNVGIGRNRGSIWLSSVMPELYRLYPDMLLTIFEDRDTNMLDKVLNGVLDVAIVETYAYHSDLHYLRLPSEQYMFITSSEIAAGESSLTSRIRISANSLTRAAVSYKTVRRTRCRRPFGVVMSGVANKQRNASGVRYFAGGADETILGILCI